MVQGWGGQHLKDILKMWCRRRRLKKNDDGILEYKDFSSFKQKGEMIFRLKNLQEKKKKETVEIKTMNHLLHLAFGNPY